MVFEIADIRIHPGTNDEFETAIELGLRTIIGKAEGFKRYVISRSIESPERYILQISWETLESHTIGFRSSTAYVEWRNIVGRFFAQPPSVEHFEDVSSG
jgi:heme-degrading monooxygenase HmoA